MKRSSKPLPWAVLLLALLPAPGASQDAPPAVGSYAPQFEMPDCEGTMRRLA